MQALTSTCCAFGDCFECYHRPRGESVRVVRGLAETVAELRGLAAAWRFHSPVIAYALEGEALVRVVDLAVARRY